MKKTGVIHVPVVILLIAFVSTVAGGCEPDMVLAALFMSYKSQAPEYNDTVSPSKQYSCFVDEIDRFYEIRIMKGDEVAYADNEGYRMRDRFYLAWSPDEDVLWVYSGDIGLFYLYIENDMWVKEAIGPSDECKFEIPLYVKENTGSAFREELKGN